MIAAFITWLQIKVLGRSDIYIGEDLYMRRWRIGPDWFFGLRLHHIVRGDADRELHDHPFSFLSFILSGGYWEHRQDGSLKWYGAGSILYRKAETLHRLDLGLTTKRKLADVNDIALRPTWTFVIRGPIRRQWGFLTSQGWMHWKTFTAWKHGRGTEAGGKYAAPSSL
jgi:hypothetical protein